MKEFKKLSKEFGMEILMSWIIPLVFCVSLFVGCGSSEETPLVPTITNEVETEEVIPSRVKMIETKIIRPKEGSYLFISTIMEIDGHEYSVVTSSRAYASGISQLHLESCPCTKPPDHPFKDIN